MKRARDIYGDIDHEFDTRFLGTWNLSAVIRGKGSDLTATYGVMKERRFEHLLEWWNAISSEEQKTWCKLIHERLTYPMMEFQPDVPDSLLAMSGTFLPNEMTYQGQWHSFRADVFSKFVYWMGALRNR